MADENQREDIEKKLSKKKKSINFSNVETREEGIKLIDQFLADNFENPQIRGINRIIMITNLEMELYKKANEKLKKLNWTP